MNKAITYSSTGLVFGHLWGGGKGAYAARPLFSDKLSILIQQANMGLDGSLDAGMGYESLIGAMLIVTKRTAIVIKGRIFVNEEQQRRWVGKLSKSEKMFLTKCN